MIRKIIEKYETEHTLRYHLKTWLCFSAFHIATVRVMHILYYTYHNYKISTVGTKDFNIDCKGQDIVTVSVLSPLLSYDAFGPFLSVFIPWFSAVLFTGLVQIW